jgi:hypothetical protein
MWPSRYSIIWGLHNGHVNREAAWNIFHIADEKRQKKWKQQYRPEHCTSRTAPASEFISSRRLNANRRPALSNPLKNYSLWGNSVVKGYVFLPTKSKRNNRLYTTLGTQDLRQLAVPLNLRIYVLVRISHPWCPGSTASTELIRWIAYTSAYLWGGVLFFFLWSATNVAVE